MSRRKKWKLVAIGSLALVLLTALFSCLRGTDPPAGKDRPTVLQGHKFPVQALAFGPDGATLAAAGYVLQDPQGWEVTVWDVGAGHPAAPRTEHAEAVRCLAMAPGGRVLAVAGQDQSLWLWETASTRGRRLGEHRCRVEALALSGDGSLLAAADSENVVTLWDVTSGRPKAICQGTVTLVRALAFTPDSTTLAGSGWENTVRLWDTATGEERGVLRGHSRAVVTVAFSPDGQTLASGDLCGVVTLWDVASLTKRAVLESTADKVFVNEVTALAFSPDGQTLAVAVEREVELWDVGTGEFVARLPGHEGKVKCLVYAPDGTRLASGSYDQTVQLWDVAGYRHTP